AGWDCTNFLQFNYGGGGAQVYHNTLTPPTHPFRSQMWNGTCDEGQLTAGGLQDAIAHGKDFWELYHGTLGFLNQVDESEIHIRTSTEDRTMQVASGMLFGMDPASAQRSWPVYTQPSTIDSLVPSYSCPQADAVRAAYQSVPAWTDHLSQNAGLKARLDATLGTAGLADWASWYDHFFDTFSSRTCNGHTLPCNSTGACVSEADAAQVFAIGDFEYNYIWNTAENATEYNQLTFGVMFSELAQNFISFSAGHETHRLRLYVGHDGSLIRLASGLGFGQQSSLRWPALGSEVVMEVWKLKGEFYVRVLHEGTVVEGMSWVPISVFVDKLQAQVPADIFQRCMQVSA
ncbi:phosphoglycerate mutase-like protein, partial [Artomyces pyxidatus]